MSRLGYSAKDLLTEANDLTYSDELEIEKKRIRLKNVEIKALLLIADFFMQVVNESSEIKIKLNNND